MQGEAEHALRCRPPSLPNRPHFDADSIDSAIPRPLEFDDFAVPCRNEKKYAAEGSEIAAQEIGKHYSTYGEESATGWFPALVRNPGAQT
jgi:hypothetical protein